MSNPANPVELMQSVDQYKTALEAVLKQGKAADKISILNVVLSRDRVARQIRNADSPAEDQLLRVLALDGALRGAAQAIARTVGVKALGEWRASLGDEANWWWTLDRIGPLRSRFGTLSIVVAWIFVALSLSVIVEDLRRLLAGASDGLSTAVQALLAFLLGGTAIQYARQLLGASEKEKAATSISVKGQYIFALVLIISAVVLEWQLPHLAAWFSDQGTKFGAQQRPRALSYYQRASALNPDDGITHLNLAGFYEEMFDYDKAESEYLAAIRSNAGLPPAYDRLGRLSILRRKDYGNALRLFDIGLSQFALLPHSPPSGIDLNHWQYRLLVDQAWAYFGLGAYSDAEADLKQAARVEPLSASGVCLIAQVQSRRSEFKDEKDSKEDCMRLAAIDQHRSEIEPEWLSLAKEPATDQKTSAKGVKNAR
jgi:tetratricopeptide (TPR) repeat protein